MFPLIFIFSITIIDTKAKHPSITSGFLISPKVTNVTGWSPTTPIISKPIIAKKRSKKADEQLNEQDQVNKKLKQSVNIDSNVNDLDTTAKNKNNEITVDPIEIPLDGTFKEILFLSLLLLLLLAIVIGYDINNTIVKALIDDPILTK